MSAALPVVRLVELRDTALDVVEVLDAVSDLSVGGVDVFVGTVRDHDHEQGVTGLEYSAHPTALARLRDVVDEVVAKYDVCAVAAVHRGEAFEATRALIDDLKATVPIWKHQRFADGTEEWVGTP